MHNLFSNLEELGKDAVRFAIDWDFTSCIVHTILVYLNLSYLLSRAGGGTKPVETQQPLLLKKGAKECRLF